MTFDGAAFNINIIAQNLPRFLEIYNEIRAAQQKFKEEESTVKAAVVAPSAISSSASSFTRVVSPVSESQQKQINAFVQDMQSYKASSEKLTQEAEVQEWVQEVEDEITNRPSSVDLEVEELTRIRPASTSSSGSSGRSSSSAISMSSSLTSPDPEVIVI